MIEYPPAKRLLDDYWKAYQILNFSHSDRLIPNFQGILRKTHTNQTNGNLLLWSDRRVFWTRPCCCQRPPSRQRCETTDEVAGGEPKFEPHPNIRYIHIYVKSLNIKTYRFQSMGPIRIRRSELMIKDQEGRNRKI